MVQYKVIPKGEGQKLDGWPEWSNVVPIWTSKKVQTKLPWNLIRTRKKGGTNQATLKFDLDE